MVKILHTGQPPRYRYTKIKLPLSTIEVWLHLFVTEEIPVPIE
jgi:hypothetical protein